LSSPTGEYTEQELRPVDRYFFLVGLAYEIPW